MPLRQVTGYYAVGIHPWFLEDVDGQFRWLEEAASWPHVLAIGECGLDKWAEFPIELQEAVFRKCIGLSEKRHLPLIIHQVRCTDRLIAIKRELNPDMPWIVHGFRGKPELASQCLHHGLYLSFGEKFQEEALRRVPLDRLLLETDESRIGIERIYRRVAEARSMALEELAEALEMNVRKIFFR